MYILLCGAAAIIPALMLVRYFVKSDRFPEPAGVLVKTYFYGFLITIPILIAELTISHFVDEMQSQVLRALLTAFVVAGLCEEYFKYRVLDRFCAKDSAFDEPMDAIVYGAVASLGFATLENILYVSDGGITVAVLRAFSAVPAHAAFGAIMGYHYSKAHFTPGEHKQRTRYGNALFIPILLHGLYDAPIFLLEVTSVSDSTPLALGLIIGWFVLLRWMYVHTKKIVAEIRAKQDFQPTTAASIS